MSNCIVHMYNGSMQFLSMHETVSLANSFVDTVQNEKVSDIKCNH